MLPDRNTVISQSYFISGKEYLSQAVKMTYKKIISTSLPIALSNDELLLIVDESIANAMEHGNKWDARKRVEVSIERCYEGVRITIKDEGEGFDVNRIRLSEKTLSFRGNGITILKHYCECRWNPTGNIISIILPISGACDQVLSPPLILSVKNMRQER